MKKVFSLVLICVLLVTALAGCGGSEQTKSDQSNNVTIRFWQAGGDTNGASQKMAEIIQKFQDANPNIKVEYQAIPWAENPHDKFSTSIAGGDIADLLIVGNPFDTVLANSGAVVSLDQFIDDSFKSDVMDTFLKQSTYEGKMTELKGKIISLPIYGSSRTLIYNKDLLKAANVPEPTDKGWTLEDFKKYALAMTKDTDNDGVVDQYGFGTSAKYVSQYLPFVWDLGGDICNADLTKSTINTQEWKDALTYYIDMLQKASLPGSINLALQDVEKLFAEGKVAMMVDAMDFANKIIQEPSIKDKVGIGQMPIGKSQNTYAGADVFVITKQSKHQKEAWQLMKFILNTENEKDYCKTVGFMPILKSAASDPYFTGDIVKKGYSQALTYGRFYVKSDKANAITKIISAEVQNIIGGQKTMDQALADAQKQIDSTLAQ